MTLQEFFSYYPTAALGLSGGVDSAYLLYAARQCGAAVQPYYIKTAFQPAFELADAKRICAQLELPLKILHADILSIPAVAENPKNRCYYCKRALFGMLAEHAAQDGYVILLDGTNASDPAQDRPGMKALRELSVLSPLRQCGITKAQVRLHAKQAGLFLWDKPAYACLATRVPSGTLLTQELLTRIEQAEQALTALGFTDFRVRLYHDAARIELTAAQLPLAAQLHAQITQALQPSFPKILLDLEARHASE